MLVCVVGVSNSGKSTIVNALIRKWNIFFMPTATTRPMRPNEFESQPYFFVSRRKFEKAKKKNEFFETCEVHKGYFYGSLKKVYYDMIAENKVLIKDIDYVGIEELKRQGLDIVTIFVRPSNMNVLAERARKRGEPEDKIKLRLSRAQKELEYQKKSDYCVINDDIDKAIKDFEEILKFEYNKRNLEFKLNNKKDYFIVYNNSAGKGTSQKYARILAQNIKKWGDVELVESKSENFILNYFKDIDLKTELEIIVVGGDGTLGSTINATIHNNLKANVAVFPCGTANDFSRGLGIKKRLSRFVSLIKNSKAVPTDVAKVNDTYAIHAIGAGSFGHGSMQFSSVGKKNLGIFAYWIKCFFKAFKMKSQTMVIDIDGEILQEKLLFFYCSNGNVAGGFHNFAPHADIYDGYFDFVAIKKCNIFLFSWIFIKLLFGKHEKSRYVVMKKGKCFKISNFGEVNKNFIYSDIDGNSGPMLPLNIEVLKRKINIYTEKVK